MQRCNRCQTITRRSRVIYKPCRERVTVVARPIEGLFPQVDHFFCETHARQLDRRWQVTKLVNIR